MQVLPPARSGGIARAPGPAGMTGPAQPPVVFPGGMETAPEVTPGGCAHLPCLCPVEPGRTYCCPACARASAEADVCRCGHFGCSRPDF